ncbi:MAG: hypothetical protein KGJ08_09190, partial [Gammaproteobacteria bacterium]|nr:hypothetical protein [Gammaproteobacteria bacterium]
LAALGLAGCASQPSQSAAAPGYPGGTVYYGSGSLYPSPYYYNYYGYPGYPGAYGYYPPVIIVNNPPAITPPPPPPPPPVKPPPAPPHPPRPAPRPEAPKHKRFGTQTHPPR